jgi:PhnB protein
LTEWFEGYDASGPGLDLQEIEIYADERVAYATALTHVTGDLKSGVKVDMWVRTTLGFLKDGGAWKIHHEHMSAPMDFETMRAALDAKP